MTDDYGESAGLSFRAEDPVRHLPLAVLLSALPAAATADDAGASTRGIVTVPGGRLAYDIAGTGDTVVLIHDGLLPSATWDEQLVPFARRFRVVRYDRRGYGASETTTRDYSNVEDLKAVLDHVGAAKAALVGCSAGGALALDFALAHPDRVKALVLVGPVLSGFGFSEHFLRRNAENTAPGLMRKDDAGSIERWATDPFITDARNVEARRRLKELLVRYPQSATRQIPHPARPDPDSRSRLGDVKAPLLLITGASDVPDVHAHIGAIASGVPHAERVVIARAGHLPQLEQPAEFNARVLEFLDPRGRAAELLAAGLGTPATPEARQAFDYDAGAPLALETKGKEERAEAYVFDVTFASGGARVPAYIVEPKAAGPHAGIVFLHHGQGNRTTFLDEAVGLAARGVVSVSFDAPPMRPEAQASAALPFDVADERREIVQTVVDIRRAFDVLAARSDVDAKRLAFVGYSLGATMGARLAGLDTRPSALVLIAGFPALSYDMGDGHGTAAAWFDALLDAPAQKAYRDAIGPLDGTHFLAGGTAPVLLQFARGDDFISPVDAELFAAATRGRSETRWYPGEHFDLGAGSPREDRAAWLARLLGLR
jgi:pimeloyl-ACP methyl ester carboxylesterase